MADSDPLSLIDATDDQIRARVTELGEANTGLRNRASVGVLRGIWETIALVVRRLYAAHVAPMYAQADRSRATGPWLRMHAAYLGVPPKPATAAEGALQALSPQAVAIDAGTQISVQDSAQRLIVSADTQVSEGAAAAVPVRAETPGAAGNVAPGSLLTMPAYPDVTVSAPRNWITTPGADAESDDALRRRVDDRWASLGAGQPEAQYRYAAESRPGIARAVVVRTPRGPGSADLVLISTAPTGVPSADQIADVTRTLDGLRMVCRDLTVRGGALVDVDIRVFYRGPYSDAQVQSAIKQEIDADVDSAAVRVAAIYRAAAVRLPNLEYFGIAEPLHDVVPAPGDLPQISVAATVGEAPASGGGGTATGGQAIAGSLPYGVRTAAGALTPQPPKVPTASGRWALAMPALAAGQTWYFGPLPSGVELTAVEQFTFDVTADWQLDAATGLYVYAHGPSVPAGVRTDVEITARRVSAA